MLNGVIEERLKEIKEERKKKGNPNPDPAVFDADEKDLFRETVSLFRLVKIEPGKNITIGEEKDKDGKKFWVMRIKYAEIPADEETITMHAISTSAADMENLIKFHVIRALLYKHNLQLYEGDVGKEVRETLEKNTLEGYKDIIARLQGPRLGNVLIDHIGHSNALSLVYKLQAAVEEIELQANIEVY